MKPLVLALALILQSTGLWPHLPEITRSAIIQASVVEPRVASLDAVATESTKLPVRVADASLALSARSAYAIDEATSLPLYSKEASVPRPIASITKLVTAVVILSRHAPSDKVTVGRLPNYDPSAEVMGLREGDRYTVGDLLKAALIPSYNDAADALALSDSGSITKFAAQMNLKMNEWGITGTRFVSASGLSDAGNYATALALTKIAKLALANPVIAATVQTDSTTIASAGGRVTQLDSTNKLLATGSFYGIKTGYTQAAGECFVGLTRIGEHRVITVVLGSNDRFGDTQTLINWIGKDYQWL